MIKLFLILSLFFYYCDVFSTDVMSRSGHLIDYDTRITREFDSFNQQYLKEFFNRPEVKQEFKILEEIATRINAKRGQLSSERKEYLKQLAKKTEVQDSQTNSNSVINAIPMTEETLPIKEEPEVQNPVTEISGPVINAIPMTEALQIKAKNEEIPCAKKSEIQDPVTETPYPVISEIPCATEPEVRNPVTEISGPVINAIPMTKALQIKAKNEEIPCAKKSEIQDPVTETPYPVISEIPCATEPEVRNPVTEISGPVRSDSVAVSLNECDWNLYNDFFDPNDMPKVPELTIPTVQPHASIENPTISSLTRKNHTTILSHHAEPFYGHHFDILPVVAPKKQFVGKAMHKDAIKNHFRDLKNAMGATSSKSISTIETLPIEAEQEKEQEEIENIIKDESKIEALKIEKDQKFLKCMEEMLLCFCKTDIDSVTKTRARILISDIHLTIKSGYICMQKDLEYLIQTSIKLGLAIESTGLEIEVLKDQNGTLNVAKKYGYSNKTKIASQKKINYKNK